MKQRDATRRLTPPLNLRQGTEVVLPSFELAGLKLLQPGNQLNVRSDVDAHRERIDEQSDDRLHSVDCRGTAGDHATEHNVVRAGVSAQEHGPGALHERVQRQPIPASEGPQRRRRVGRNPELLFVRGSVRYDGMSATSVDPQWHWTLIASQDIAPVDFGSGLVLLLQPADVVTVTRARRELKVASLAVRFIVGGHLRKQDHEAPSIEDDVMKGDDQL